MTRDEVLLCAAKMPLIAILRGNFRGCEVELAGALLEAGVLVLEVSTVSPDYAESIAGIVSAYGKRLAVGVGTALTPDHVSAATDAGASFTVAPNLNFAVLDRAKKLGLATFPGAYTATEVVEAVDAGADAVKLFPAVSLGPDYVKALRGPLPDVRLVPTGGVNVANIPAYFAAGAWAVAVGSELVRSDEAKIADWKQLNERAKHFVAAVEARA